MFKINNHSRHSIKIHVIKVKAKKGKVIPVILTEHDDMKVYWGGGIALLIL
jgi:hypothetical protein